MSHNQHNQTQSIDRKARIIQSFYNTYVKGCSCKATVLLHQGCVNLKMILSKDSFPVSLLIKNYNNDLTRNTMVSYTLLSMIL